MQGLVWSSVGSTAAASHKVAKASMLAEASTPASPTSAGLQFLQIGDLSQAEACFQSALAQTPSDTAALTGMTSVMLSRRDTEGAEKWLARASAANAPAPQLQHLRLTLDLLKGNGAAAQEALLQATKQAPSDPRYWIMLADVLLKQKDLQRVAYEILPALQEALKTQDHYLVHAVRGFLLKGKGERSYKEARLAFLRALSMNASLPDVWTALLDVDIAMGNADFIESDARSLLAVDPDHALANYLLGSLWLSRNAFDRSEDFLRRSIDKLATAPACNNLSENLRAQQRLEEAETFARKALAIQPDFPPSLDTLANILFDTQRLEEAAKLAEQADSKSPGTAAYQLTLLRVRVRQSRLDDALSLSEKLKASKTPVPATLEKELSLLQKQMAKDKKPATGI